MTRALSKKGKRGKRSQQKRAEVLGKGRFEVARGESEKLRIRFRKRGLAGQALAQTKPCAVRGKGGCRSWLDLR